MDNNSMLEIQFKNKLDSIRANDKKTLLIGKQEYFELVQELKSAASLSTVKSSRQYYILSK